MYNFNKKTNILLFSIAISSTALAQVDYSKQPSSAKNYTYLGDTGATVSTTTTQPKIQLDARDQPNLGGANPRPLQSQSNNKATSSHTTVINNSDRYNNTKFEGYNQLQKINKSQIKPANISNANINYTLTDFQNPTQIQNNPKYKHLFNSDNGNFCWDQAAQYYQLDPWLLFSVAKVESSFNPLAINSNSNKSKDYGLMQINSFWLSKLKDLGIEKEHLFDPCTSIFVGAWIMKNNIVRMGYNIDGIGAYNSPNNPTLRRRYGRKVYEAYNELVKDFKPN